MHITAKITFIHDKKTFTCPKHNDLFKQIFLRLVICMWNCVRTFIGIKRRAFILEGCVFCPPSRKKKNKVTVSRETCRENDKPFRRSFPWTLFYLVPSNESLEPQDWSPMRKTVIGVFLSVLVRKKTVDTLLWSQGSYQKWSAPSVCEWLTLMAIL